MKTALTALLVGSHLCSASLFSQSSVTTEPVGFNTVTALGNSDTRFSFPLHRSAEYQGLVQSVASNVITVQGAPNWAIAPKKWVYIAGSQANTYYVEFVTGNKKGMGYTITDNGANTLTLNLNGDVIAGATNQVVAGDTVKVIPYWTLATLFPAQQGIASTTSIFGAGATTKILVTDSASTGINLPPAATYYYYSGTSYGGAGWRKIGAGFANKKDDEVLVPDAPVIVRQTAAANTQLVVTGGVPVNDRKYILGTYAANQPQDNFIAVDVPVPLTLSAANLFQAGVFTGTTDILGATGDKLLVYNDAVAGLNKAPSATYFYYTDTANSGPGWRLVNGGATTVRNNDIVFQPGSGYIIRKQGNATPSSIFWSLPLPY